MASVVERRHQILECSELTVFVRMFRLGSLQMMPLSDAGAFHLDVHDRSSTVCGIIQLCPPHAHFPST
jgi:hypothetical protein